MWSRLAPSESCWQNENRHKAFEIAYRINQGITLPSTTMQLNARLVLPSVMLTWLLPLCSQRHNPNPITEKTLQLFFWAVTVNRQDIYTSAWEESPTSSQKSEFEGFPATFYISIFSLKSSMQMRPGREGRGRRKCKRICEWVDTNIAQIAAKAATQ